MPLVTALVSALLNLLILAGIPFLLYFAFHRSRRGRTFAEIAKRAGLQLGEPRYLGYCALFAVVVVALLLIWSPKLEPFTGEGSAWRSFVGLGFSGTSVVMALLYGVVKTGFGEEFLFRGLIAGSLSRRLSLTQANLVQALIFLAPHVVILKVMPEAWTILPFIFVGSLFVGWARIKSGSMLGPWLVHAAVNTAMGLSVAIRTVG